MTTLGANEVEKRIAPFGMYFRSFKDYCRKNGHLRKEGREYLFQDSFIEELTEEWILKEEVMAAFGIKKRRFYRMIQEKKWPTMKIGGVLLVKARKLIQSMKNRCVFVHFLKF